jgi:hypothetical protein
VGQIPKRENLLLMPAENWVGSSRRRLCSLFAVQYDGGFGPGRAGKPSLA